MAKLKNPDASITLVRPYHIVGRKPDFSNTLLRNEETSNLHSTIRWSGTNWQIRDHSRNGTWINDKRLDQRPRTLHMGDRLRFSSEVGEWEVVDTEAPKSILIASDGTQYVLDTYQDYEVDPITAIYERLGAGWMLEIGGEQTTLTHGDSIDIDGSKYRFWDGSVDVETSDIFNAKNQLTFEFDVSLNEENVALSIIHDKAVVELGHRVHHYFALQLAERIVDHIQQGIPKAELGWTDVQVLSTTLGLSPEHLNIQVCRLRRQLSDNLAPFSGHEVIERRPGEIRLATISLRIRKGASEITVLNGVIQ